ncbi:hypothetical protein BJX99DRAFT_237980 [Aspergillus californicus]
MKNAVEGNTRATKRFARPLPNTDRLFLTEYPHLTQAENCKDYMNGPRSAASRALLALHLCHLPGWLGRPQIPTGYEAPSLKQGPVD